MNHPRQSLPSVPTIRALLLTAGLLSVTTVRRQGAAGSAGATVKPTPKVPSIVVSGFGKDDIQRAIDAAPAGGACVVLPAGTYALGANLNVADKTNLTIDGRGAATLSGTDIGNLICLTGAVKNLRITGLHFVGNKTRTDGYDFGLICSFEQAPITGLEIDHCTFTTPRCGINGIKLNPHSGSNGVRVTNVRIHHNQFTNMGRMGIELQNHGWDNGDLTYRFDGVNVSSNRFTNLGLADGNNGMAVSLSGLGQNLIVANNEVMDAKGYALEVVGGRRAGITKNVIRANHNTFVGISITDNNHRVTEQITVANNSVSVRGRAILIYGARNCTVTANTLLSGQANDFIVSGSTFRANTVRATDHNAMIFEDYCTDNRIMENSFSNAGFSDCYALLSFRGSNTRGNSATQNKLILGKPGNRPETEQINGASGNTLSDNVLVR